MPTGIEIAIPSNRVKNVAQVALNNGSQTQLSATKFTSDPSQGILVQSLAANTVKIYVGASGVNASNGVELAPGDSVMLPVQDPTQVYIFAGASGQVANAIAV